MKGGQPKFAFEAQLWKATMKRMFNLKTVFRQSDPSAKPNENSSIVTKLLYSICQYAERNAIWATEYQVHQYIQVAIPGDKS